MSVLYLGTDPGDLAVKLAHNLDDPEQCGDCFVPITIVAPNQYLGRWLQLWLARRQGIAINLRFTYLEATLWELLRAVDPRPHDLPPELVSAEHYELMTLAALWHDEHPDLEIFQRYFGHGRNLDHAGCRRAWQLAQTLGTLIRNYEYHRQELLIQHWLKDEVGLLGADLGTQRLERAQKAIFRSIVAEPDGKRARLGRALGKNLRTLPQYAKEVMELPEARPLSDRTIHLFGITQISALHMETLRWLGRLVDLRLYHLNPFNAWLEGTPNRLWIQQRLRSFDADPTPSAPAGTELLRQWGRGGSESLGILAELLTDRRFSVELVNSAKPRAKARKIEESEQPSLFPDEPTVLQRLQDHLLGRARNDEGPIPQDTTLQIVACPGVVREVETVHQSILHNLHTDPKLKQTDIAVLVTDLALYRPVIQGMFERQPKLLRYSLIDYSASGQSSFGQALLGMLDLALESFTRSRVLTVLLNPCFLTRLRITADEAQTFVRWIERLGIYHGWDAGDKAERGYAASPWHSWQLGLRRLRLGRYMAAPADGDTAPACFGDVVPYADLDSADRDQLDAFSRAIESLLPWLLRLRRTTTSAATWAKLASQLVAQFLDVPAEEPAEHAVRDHLLAALERLEHFDALASETGEGLPLALVREYLAASLSALPGRRGDPLTGGVTIAGLLPMRPVPFAVMYVLGLGEAHFPGRNELPTFDLRRAPRLPGDIRPAEQNRFLFLETLLAAQRKLHLFYNARDLQKDEKLLPAAPVQQLRRFLGEHIVGREFKVIEAPLHGCDPKLLGTQCGAGLQPAGEDEQVESLVHATDVLVQYQPMERLAAVRDGVAHGEIALSAAQTKELERETRQRVPDFAVPATPPTEVKRTLTIPLRQLANFLKDPAEAYLRRHLRLADEGEQEFADDEPLATPWLNAGSLINAVLREVVASEDGIEEALRSWPGRLNELFRLRQRQSLAPEDAFGDVDRAGLQRSLQERLDGDEGLEAFLRQRAMGSFCGPILLGESLAPIRPRHHFAALRLHVGEHEVRLVGSFDLAWTDNAWLDLLMLTYTKKLPSDQVCPQLAEPFLFALALWANDEAIRRRPSPRRWLGGRGFRAHLANAQGLVSFAYPAGAITPEQATEYLHSLVADYLDPASFDHLPMAIIANKEPLRQAYFPSESASSDSDDAYRALLQDAIEEERDEFSFKYREKESVGMTRPEVPRDARTKVRRRLALLDIGPALAREAADA